MLTDGTESVELEYDASAATIQTALQQFESIGFGKVTVADGSAANLKQISIDKPTSPTLSASGGASISASSITTDYLRLSGLGLSSGSVNGLKFDGVLLQNTENLDILLGDHDDVFALDATPIAGQPVSTRLSLGGGDDEVTISAALGETTILGGAGSDQVTVNADQSRGAQHPRQPAHRRQRRHL